MKNIKSYYSSQNLYNTKKCLKNKCNAKYSVLCRKFAGETNYNIGMQAVSPLLFAAKYHRKTMGGMLCIYTPKEYIHNERSDYHILWQYIIAGELEGFIQKKSFFGNLLFHRYFLLRSVLKVPTVSIALFGILSLISPHLYESQTKNTIFHIFFLLFSDFSIFYSHIGRYIPQK